MSFLAGKRKSQAIIFENVLIFTVSIAIFILLFAVFNIYQSYFTYVSVDDHLTEVGNYITSHIILLAEKGDANSSTIIVVPKTIGGEPYEIELLEDSLRVMTMNTQVSKFTSLYNLPFEFVPKKIPGTRGKITLKKNGNQIIIGA